MKKIRNTRAMILLPLLILLGSLLLPAASFGGEGSGQELTILFTHDMHDYYYPTVTRVGGVETEHGGAARLATILKENRDENTVYLDAGDFSMGTLYQAAFSTEAFEMRLLGLLGCQATTFGNHEFDYGAKGVAQALRSAAGSGEPLPEIVISNIEFGVELDEAQQDLKAAFDEYGIREYTILNCAGYKIGVFGLEGEDSIECIQTSIPFANYIDQAGITVAKLQAENCDLIVALSHAGTNGKGEGEDVLLAQSVPGIDVIISGHSHATTSEPLKVGDTLIVSAGEYLRNVGELKITKDRNGLQETGFRLIPVNGGVKEDEEVQAFLNKAQENIEDAYLKEQTGTQTGFDQVIAHSKFDTLTLSEMYASHGEYNTGNLIADSYLYEAEKNGIHDIDVALVGLGTIRASVKEGPIRVADAFEICSLGVGSDGSAGHPLVCVYITGKEMKLLTELDASLGPLVGAIKMSYSGLSFSFNEKRLLLDRVTRVQLVRRDGSTEEIQDGKLYKICANMYALNMLGMLNGLTKGVLSITLKNADGTPVTNYYDAAMKTPEGREVKEWIAFKDYLESFPVEEQGVPEVPETYREPQGRKVKYSEGGLAVISNPGTATKVMPTLLLIVAGVLILLTAGIVLLVRWIRKKKEKRKEVKENGTGNERGN